MKYNTQCLEKHHAVELIQLKDVNLGRRFLLFLKKTIFFSLHQFPNSI